jgi:hypothetical protein
LLVVEVLLPVAVFTMETFAPAINADAASRTTPCTVPLPVWAGNIKADITIKIANRLARYKSMVFSSKPGDFPSPCGARHGGGEPTLSNTSDIAVNHNLILLGSQQFFVSLSSRRVRSAGKRAA